jgi:centromere protein X
MAEAINRAGKLAEAEASPTIEAHHLQQILPQLLLDFS